MHSRIATSADDHNGLWVKAGLRRVPVMTLTVFLITVITNTAQVVDSGLVESWQRSPQMLHGEWWRLGTALFVQDGGVLGAVSNLAFLLVLGALCEQVLARWEWLACYLGAGVIGEIVGHFWQPVGAGNSVAVCGLAGALVVALWVGDSFLPTLTPYAAMYWAGALLAQRWWLLGLIFLVAVFPASQVAGRFGAEAARFSAAVTVVVALALVGGTDIHGAALLGGVAIGALLNLLAPRRHGGRRPRLTTSLVV